MQIGPRQAKNFKILRDRGKGGIEVGARSAELDGGGGAMAADAAVAELHSYLEESLQGYLALDIVSFCAYCPCRSIQIVDGRMPPISGTDSLCQISGETARFGDEALGRQGLTGRFARLTSAGLGCCGTRCGWKRSLLLRVAGAGFKPRPTAGVVKMSTSTYKMVLPGAMIRRGFWLYGCKIGTPKL